MDLYEHQARDLFEAYGIPVPRAGLARTPRQARETAELLGGPTVVTAQIRAGGRTGAGGIRHTADPAAVEAAARHLLGMNLDGHRVRSVLVAEAVQPPCSGREFTVGYTLDRSAGRFLAVLRTGPGADLRIPVDPLEGVTPAGAAQLLAETAELMPRAADILNRLWRLLTNEDALQVEAGPLVVTGAPEAAGPLTALGCRITLDTNARFRQARWGEDSTVPDDPLEARAAARGLTCVRLGGEVGVIGNGAGLGMATLDLVADHGARPATFLDIGGGDPARAMADALTIVLADPAVRSVLVHVFGGITPCDAVAEGIVRALDTVHLTHPLVVRLDGNRAARGRDLLTLHHHPLVHQAATMDDAARLAAQLARGGPPATPHPVAPADRD
ncbi:ATP-grasp domain-containing protein [Streptomyces sp. NPDC058045]|uniref:ATP-grasp domain-containing protein n=1 Tax=Streptomyces sp. NPDC058045 TaxID=3346311 RepID=UPI0036EC5565